MSYLEWVRHVFDRPVTEPVDEGDWDPEPQQCVEFLTELFTDPEPAVASYSDAQVNQGFWDLVSNGCSNYIFSLIEPPVAWPLRRECIRSITTLFARLFAKRCSDHLSHLDEQGAGALNLVCYMWWDLFPAYGRPEDPTRASLDDELLAAMKDVLALDSVACQESALHGLGHWQRAYPAFVEKAIDGFLARHQDMRPELRQYAQWARVGHVQ